jgi:hypothetical protein
MSRPDGPTVGWGSELCNRVRDYELQLRAQQWLMSGKKAVVDSKSRSCDQLAGGAPINPLGIPILLCNSSKRCRESSFDRRECLVEISVTMHAHDLQHDPQGLRGTLRIARGELSPEAGSEA